MSEEEKEAIEILSLKSITSSIEAPNYPNCIVMKKDLQIVLNLIETQKAEINKFQFHLQAEEQQREHDMKEIDRLKGECVKKDKIIDLMADNLTSPIHDKKWVIEYYTKLAEEEK